MAQGTGAVAARRHRRDPRCRRAVATRRRGKGDERRAQPRSLDRLNAPGRRAARRPWRRLDPRRFAQSVGCAGRGGARPLGKRAEGEGGARSRCAAIGPRPAARCRAAAGAHQRPAAHACHPVLQDRASGCRTTAGSSTRRRKRRSGRLGRLPRPLGGALPAGGLPAGAAGAPGAQRHGERPGVLRA